MDPSLPEADDQNRIVTATSSAAAHSYAEAGYTTMLDGIYGPWFLEIVQANAPGADLHYLVLRADLETSLQRAVGRADEPTTEDVVRRMHGHFDQLGQYEKFVIDTTSSTPEEITAHVVDRVASGDLTLT